MASAYDSMIEDAPSERRKKVLQASKAAHLVADKSLTVQDSLEHIESDAVSDKTLDAYEQFFTCVANFIDQFTANCNLIKGGMEYAATASETPQDDGSIGR